MKRCYSLLMLLIAIIPLLNTQSTNAQNMKSLNKEYRIFWDDFSLIKKCYFTKSPACNENERKKARWAMVRVVGEGLALAATITAVGLGGYYYFAGPKVSKIISDIKNIIPRVQQVEFEKSNIILIFDSYKASQLTRQEAEKIIETLKNISKKTYLVRKYPTDTGMSHSLFMLGFLEEAISLKGIVEEFIPNNVATIEIINNKLEIEVVHGITSDTEQKIFAAIQKKYPKVKGIDIKIAQKWRKDLVGKY